MSKLSPVKTMEENREFQVGQPKEKSALHKFGEILGLTFFGLMLLSPVVRWMIVSPCDRAAQDLAESKSQQGKTWKRIEDGRSPSMGADNVAIQDAKADVEKSESAARTACSDRK